MTFPMIWFPGEPLLNPGQTISQSAANRLKTQTRGLTALMHSIPEHLAEKQPWEDAQPGEVWVITVDGEELLCRSNSDGDFTPVFGHHHWVTISNGSHAITAGRRIWPETEEEDQ